MNEDETKSIITPETDKVKEILGMASLQVADLFAKIRSTYKYIRYGGGEEQKKKLQELIFELEEVVQGVFLSVKAYLRGEDEEEYRYWDERLKKLDDEYTLEEIKRMVEFTERILNNLNLSEVGRKSRIKEIEDTIDVRRILAEVNNEIDGSS